MQFGFTKTCLSTTARMLLPLAFGLGAMQCKADQFNITASSPGSLNFQGEGTAQFNNSVGSNNSFQVGSASSLGVNASASSTPEYGVVASAHLSLAGATRLKQTIGTSGTESAQSHRHARHSADARMADLGWGQSWGDGSTNHAGNTYANEAAWRTARNSAYNAEYSNAFSAINAIDNTSDGLISGSFKTVENSRSGSGGHSSDWEATATAAVNKQFGSDYSNRNSDYELYSETDYAAARETAFNREYASASASNNRFSDSQVTVNGIGSDVNIVASDESSFTTKIQRNPHINSGTGIATANSSAGLSLSTVSLANQSQSQTASAFIQSFSSSR